MSYRSEIFILHILIRRKSIITMETDYDQPWCYLPLFLMKPKGMDHGSYQISVSHWFAFPVVNMSSKAFSTIVASIFHIVYYNMCVTQKLSDTVISSKINEMSFTTVIGHQNIVNKHEESSTVMINFSEYITLQVFGF